MDNSPLVVNLFGGPGAGKSTMATRLFSDLKELGVNCEYVPEYAKDLTWEKRYMTLDDQLYIFAKQHHRLWRLKDQVEVIITDSPLLLSLVYGSLSRNFQELVMEEFSNWRNYNVLINRVKPFNPKGRNQDEEGAKSLDLIVNSMLARSATYLHLTVDGNKEGCALALSRVIENI